MMPKLSPTHPSTSRARASHAKGFRKMVMAKKAPFMVILSPQLTAEQAELLAPVVHEYTQPSGQLARVLWCKMSVFT